MATRALTSVHLLARIYLPRVVVRPDLFSLRRPAGVRPGHAQPALRHGDGRVQSARHVLRGAGVGGRAVRLRARRDRHLAVRRQRRAAERQTLPPDPARRHDARRAPVRHDRRDRERQRRRRRRRRRIHLHRWRHLQLRRLVRARRSGRSALASLL